MLPKHIFPRTYDLTFDLDMKKFKFKGKERIAIYISKSSRRIKLNSKNLDVKKIKLKKDGLEIIPDFKLNEKEELLEIKSQKRIRGEWNLFIEFSGRFSEDLKGFYLSKYNHGGKEKHIATTQFEAPYARKAFPCFDQPDMKAEFLVSLNVDKNFKTVSNMPIISEKLKGNKKLVKFEKTPIMSTYLLYMGIGEFEYLEGNYENRVDLRIVTIPGKRNQGKFALDITKKALKYFEEYTRIDYPLPKLDLIALPNFASAAMENWGAITFREIALLISQNTSFRIKRRLAMVIAHELWHMWSGNLVTMKWWDDLWLNESFANYMAYKALDYYFPEWGIWENYLESEFLWGIGTDSLKSTHTISVKVKNPHEIEELFDGISYAKGGSVLRMIESFLGEETFRKGVSHYIDKFKYENAEARDFWNCLSRFSKENIRKIARSWINQPGYPLVKVRSRGKKLILEQEPFNKVFKGQLWSIPLTILSGGETKTVLLKNRRQKIKVNSKYFKLNYNQTGFYRVRYDLKDLKNIKELVVKNRLPSIDLFGVVNDLFYLALHGKISINHYLEFAKLCKNDKDYMVLSEVHRNLYRIDRIFSKLHNWDELFSKLKGNFKTTFFNAFLNLGWRPKKDENINETLLRATTIANLSLLKNQEIILEGKKKFNSFHKDIRGVGYSLIASNGDEKDYEKILNKYRNEEDVEEKRNLLIALYKFQDVELLKRSLSLIFSGEVRLQDYPYVFNCIEVNKKSGEVFFNFVKENWEKFNEHKDTWFIFSRFLEAFIGSNFNNLNGINEFLKDKEILYKKTKDEAFESAKVEKNFLDKNLGIINKYVSKMG